MDIQTLKYYVCVAESLSFTEAASQKGVSQSAISQQIFELYKFRFIMCNFTIQKQLLTRPTGCKR